VYQVGLGSNALVGSGTKKNYALLLELFLTRRKSDIREFTARVVTDSQV
jgi:hypothetical protein